MMATKFIEFVMNAKGATNSCMTYEFYILIWHLHRTGMTYTENRVTRENAHTAQIAHHYTTPVWRFLIADETLSLLTCGRHFGTRSFLHGVICNALFLDLRETDLTYLYFSRG